MRQFLRLRQRMTSVTATAMDMDMAADMATEVVEAMVDTGLQSTETLLTQTLRSLAHQRYAAVVSKSDQLTRA